MKGHRVQLKLLAQTRQGRSHVSGQTRPSSGEPHLYYHVARRDTALGKGYWQRHPETLAIYSFVVCSDAKRATATAGAALERTPTATGS